MPSFKLVLHDNQIILPVIHTGRQNADHHLTP